jgi:hypothetical protein
MDAILSEIEEIKRGTSPKNESSTCDWVVVPLLKSVGYLKWEILSHYTDQGKDFPDYTILPEQPEYTWFLEAKAWSIELSDIHAKQALNYANHNGKRWVVLTNGREWRLYDNHLKGTFETRLVAEASMNDQSGLVSFLRAIGKDSVLGNGLERYVRQEEERRSRAKRALLCAKRREAVRTLLTDQLNSSDSAFMATVVKFLRSIEGLEDAESEDVRAWALGLQATSPEGNSTQPSLPLLPRNESCHGFMLRMTLSGVPRVKDGLNSNEIMIGWSLAKGLEKPNTTRSQVKSAIALAYPNDTAKQLGSSTGMVWRFVGEMKVGDLVVVPDGSQTYVALVLSDVRYVPEGASTDSIYRRSVKWLNDGMAVPRRILPTTIQPKLGVQSTIIRIDDAMPDLLRFLNENGMISR